MKREQILTNFRRATLSVTGVIKLLGAATRLSGRA
jgi:hypothetical protein